MASGRIKGITIEIDGDSLPLQKALKKVDSSLKDTQTQLKDVNKLLKLDPSNIDLLKQKHDYLGKAVDDTREKLKTQQKAMEQLQSAGDTEENQEQQRRLAREIIATENSLKDLEKQYRSSIPALEAFGAKSAEIAEKTKVVSTAAGALAGGLLANAYNSAKKADDLVTLSAQTGIAVEELQKMQYASNLVDVSVSDMTGSVKKLVQQMGKGADVFDKIGVSIYDSNGELRDANTVWYESLEALSKVTNETEKDALAMELFGKSASSLTGIIDDGGEAMRILGQEAEDLGLVMSGDALNSAVEFNNQMDLMKERVSMAFMEMGASLADTLVPALTTLVDKVTEVVTWFSDLDGTTQSIILVVLGLIASISPLAGLLSNITTLVGGVTSAITFLASPVGIAVVAFGALVTAGVALYQNWDTVKAKATEIYNVVAEKFNAMKDAVVGAIEKIKGVLSGFSWKLPDIKMPHFSITGGFSLNPPSVPHISVDWYKKAYDNAIMFNSPTVLATPYGYKGFGDGSGSELVIGTDTLMGMIKASNNSGELGRITSLLEVIASNGMTVTLQGDARQMFKVVRQENTKFKGSTGKSAFNY